MERSGPDDAWDDPWDGDDDGGASAYPPAPLPAHERQWRHPSEIGQSAWQHSEPPVAIGRGLLITTGAIGCVLGIAVLLLLVPIGGGLAPTAAPTATSVVAVTVADRDEPASTEPSAPDEVSTPSPVPTLPAEEVPSTVLVSAAPTDVEPGAMAIAVSIAGQRWMITTASAIRRTGDAGASAGVSIIGPGDEGSGVIVSVDHDLAFIEPGHTIEVATFDVVASAEPGQPVTVLGDRPAEVPYTPDGGVPGLDAGTVVEGTPVVDAAGALVALCTLITDGDGVYVDLVPLTLPDPSTVAGTSPAPTTGDTVPGTDPDTLDTGPSTTSTPTSVAPVAPPGTSVPAAPVAWAGLRFDGAPTGMPLTVTGVAPGSPAAAAGIGVGERIVAVGAAPVASVEGLLAEIRRRAPGDVLTFTLMSKSTASGVTPVERTVSVTLGAVAPTG